MRPGDDDPVRIADALADGLARLPIADAIAIVGAHGTSRLGRDALVAATNAARTELVRMGVVPGAVVELARTGGVAAFAEWAAAIQLAAVPCFVAGDAPTKIDPRARASAAFVQHTSGTTGAAKRVEIGHVQAIAQIDGLADALQLAEDDVIASGLPLGHDMGLVSTVLLPLLRGVAVVHVDPVAWRADPQRLLAAMTEHRATLTWLPPAALGRLCRVAATARGDLGAMRQIVCGGDVLTAATLDRFTSTFVDTGLRRDAVHPGWGMAENVAAVTHARGLHRTQVAWRSFAPGRTVQDGEGFAWISVGAPIVGTRVRVVGSPSDGTLGELEIAGTCRPERDAWLRTGDAGMIRDGAVWLCGRMDELLHVEGRWFPPQLAEEAAFTVPGVRPGRVAAIVDAADRFTMVVERGRSSAHGDAVAQAVLDGVGHRPRVRLVGADALPRTRSGKLCRRRCAALLDAP